MRRKRDFSCANQENTGGFIGVSLETPGICSCPVQVSIVIIAEVAALSRCSAEYVGCRGDLAEDFRNVEMFGPAGQQANMGMGDER
jgi:hypothetical protein